VGSLPKGTRYPLVYFRERYPSDKNKGKMAKYLACNFVDGFEINLAYFLLQILNKMTFSIQRESRSIDNSLYHHGLIKILIEAHLQAKGYN